MSESKFKRRGSSRRSSRKHGRRGRRQSSMSISSYGAFEDDDEMLMMFENDDDDDAFDDNDVERGGRRRGNEDGEEEEEEEEDEATILAKINHCKELIGGVKFQTWKMTKKMKVLTKARTYVETYEGRLSRGRGYQQRGKQLMAQAKRMYTNWIAALIPWEMRIKQIESHFGSVVASYFVFLRWLLWMSVWLAVLPTCFIIIPELLVGPSYGSTDRKTIPEEKEKTAYDLKTIWDAEGVVKYSLVFYGYYGNSNTIGNNYRLPLAYLIVSLAAFAYSFVVVLKRMASNSRQSRLSNKDEQFTFAWKLFTEWDYMIASHETATTKHASLITTFKETILEEQEKAREGKVWLTRTLRVLANVIILILLALSTYIIQLFVERSREMEIEMRSNPDLDPGFWAENELTVIMTLIATLFPNVLDLISVMEKYHPRTSLRLMLGRIFVLNLLNTYTLFIALYNKQNDLLASFKESNSTAIANCTTLFPSVNFTTTLSPSSTSSPAGTTTIGPIPLNQSFSSEGVMNTSSVSEVELCGVGAGSTGEAGLCWETMIGQEVFKLTVMDTVFVLGQIIIIDVIRTYFIKYCNTLCCWDLEKTFPEYPDFKTAENLLHLISNQGVIWLGAFFAPGLPLLNLLKLLLLVYVRCWSVMTFNAPQQRIFRASRSNNFYYALLLIMLFLCMLPPLFAIVVIKPSPDCGPFSGQERIFHILTKTMEEELPKSVNSIIEYAASPGVIMPVFMLLGIAASLSIINVVVLLLGMTIYYLLSVGRSLKDANNELRMQLEYERTEGRKKVYAMADARHDAEPKGWGAAKAKVLPGGGDSPRIANTASALMDMLKGKKPGGHPGPRSNADKLRGVVAAASGRADSTNKAAMSLLERLQSARTPNGVPVAVIKGKQSVKVNGPAARERLKNAAKSPFQRALLDYARKQASENISNSDQDHRKGPNRRAHHYKKAEHRRTDRRHSNDDNNDEDEINSQPSDDDNKVVTRQPQSRRRFQRGNDNDENSDDRENDENDEVRVATGNRQINGWREKLRNNALRKNTGLPKSAVITEDREQRRREIIKQSGNKHSREKASRSGIEEDSDGITYEDDTDRETPLERRENERNKQLNRRATPSTNSNTSSKTSDNKARSSSSKPYQFKRQKSLSDKTGHLLVEAEESSEEESEEDDYDANKEENNENGPDSDDGVNRKRVFRGRNTIDKANNPGRKSDNKSDKNTNHVQFDKRTQNQTPKRDPPTSSNSKQKGFKKHRVVADVEYVDESAGKSNETTSKTKKKWGKSFVRKASVTSLNGPVPEIKVEDFSENRSVSGDDSVHHSHDARKNDDIHNSKKDKLNISKNESNEQNSSTSNASNEKKNTKENAGKGKKGGKQDDALGAKPSFSKEERIEAQETKQKTGGSNRSTVQNEKQSSAKKLEGLQKKGGVRKMSLMFEKLADVDNSSSVIENNTSEKIDEEEENERKKEDEAVSSSNASKNNDEDKGKRLMRGLLRKVRGPGRPRTRTASTPKEIESDKNKETSPFDSSGNSNESPENIQSGVNHENTDLDEQNTVSNNNDINETRMTTTAEDDNEDQESDDLEASNASQTNFRQRSSSFGQYRRDRPSVISLGLDDDQDLSTIISGVTDSGAQHNDVDNVPEFINSPGNTATPRDDLEIDSPNEIDSTVQGPSVDKADSGGFTILAITNGKLDLDTNMDPLSLQAAEETVEENKLTSTSDRKTGFGNLMKKFQRK